MIVFLHISNTYLKILTNLNQKHVNFFFFKIYLLLKIKNINKGLLISLGNTTTHIIPIYKGKIIMENIRRINVGNFNNFEILQKNLILRN